MEHKKEKAPGSCPECGGELEHQWGEPVSLELSLRRCPACGVVHVSDYVSGYWSGYRDAMADREEQDGERRGWDN